MPIARPSRGRREPREAAVDRSLRVTWYFASQVTAEVRPTCIRDAEAPGSNPGGPTTPRNGYAFSGTNTDWGPVVEPRGEHDERHRTPGESLRAKCPVMCGFAVGGVARIDWARRPNTERNDTAGADHGPSHQRRTQGDSRIARGPARLALGAQDDPGCVADVVFRLGGRDRILSGGGGRRDPPLSHGD